MIFIIVFLGIIAISMAGCLILNIRNKTFEKSLTVITEQLGRERNMYSKDREQFEEALKTQKDATNLWAKKYYELEILLKKYEVGDSKEDKNELGGINNDTVVCN